jgi:arabinoxylan arabinofuranohydrolase
VETEKCAEGGMCLTDLHHGDWVRVVGVDFGAPGAKKFTARVASAEEGGTIEVRLDGPEGRLIGSCKVENTGGWQTWKTVTCEVSGAVGVHDLCLKFTGGDKPLLNLDYWKFE